MSETDEDDGVSSKFPTSTVTIAILLAIIPLALAIGLSFWLLGSDDEAETMLAQSQESQPNAEAPAATAQSEETVSEDPATGIGEETAASPAGSQATEDTLAQDPAGEDGKGIGSLVEGVLTALDGYMAGDDDPTPEAGQDPVTGDPAPDDLATLQPPQETPLPSTLPQPSTVQQPVLPDASSPDTSLAEAPPPEPALPETDDLAPALPETALSQDTLVEDPVAAPPPDGDHVTNDAQQTVQDTLQPQADDLSGSGATAPLPAQQEAKAWNPISIRMTSSGDGTYNLNDSLEITVSLNKDGYLYCFYKDSKSQVFRIFPNEFSPEARRPGKETIAIPGQDAGFAIVLDHPGDSEEIGCVAAEVDLLYTLPDDLKPDLAPLPVADINEMVDALSAADTLDIAEARLSISVRE